MIKINAILQKERKGETVFLPDNRDNRMGE